MTAPVDDQPVIDGLKGKVWVTFPGQSSATTSVIYGPPLRVLCGACGQEATEFDSDSDAERYARIHIAEDRELANR